MTTMTFLYKHKKKKGISFKEFQDKWKQLEQVDLDETMEWQIGNS